MRWWLLILTGCSFSSIRGGGDDGAPGDDTAMGAVDAFVARPMACDAGDASLRFCVDFEATPIGSELVDLSAGGITAVVAAIGTMDHGPEKAAMLTATSTVHVIEAGKLDIASALAIDLWIMPTGKPDPGQKFWMLDNNTQYAASFTDLGKARCVVDDRNIDSKPLPDDGKWHHIGCTYDGTTMKVYVDGVVEGCRSETIPIPINGIDGLALGANLSGTNAVPTYSEHFIGGLDNVRVWARADVDMCAASHATTCSTTCPPL